MSRTIRRKNSYGIHRALRDWIDCRSKYGGVYSKRAEVQGKERAKRSARYHSDATEQFPGPPRAIRAVEHTAHRLNAKRELERVWCNPEHEVQILNNPRWFYW